jgi:hypothetical protein
MRWYHSLPTNATFSFLFCISCCLTGGNIHITPHFMAYWHLDHFFLSIHSLFHLPPPLKSIWAKVFNENLSVYLCSCKWLLLFCVYTSSLQDWIFSKCFIHYITETPNFISTENHMYRHNLKKHDDIVCLKRTSVLAK